MPVITFLISSSGVAGRAMKIRSYSRSSMIASFLLAGRVARKFSEQSTSLKTRPLQFRLFRIGRLAAVVLGHRGLDSLTQNQLYRVAGVTDHFTRRFQLCFAHRTQNVFLAAAEDRKST